MSDHLRTPTGLWIFFLVCAAAAADPAHGTLAQGAPVAVLNVQPASLAFEPQRVGVASEPLEISVSNQGDPGSELEVELFQFVGPHGSDFGFVPGGSCPSGAVSLAGGESCTRHIAFTPSDTGLRTGTLFLQVKGDPVVINAAVSLAGEGFLPIPTLNLEPVSLQFDPQRVGTQSEPLLVSVINEGEPGSELLIVTSFFVDAHPNDFAVLPGGSCPATPFILEAGESCTKPLVFAPTAVGERLARLNVEVLDFVVVINNQVSVAGEGFVPVAAIDVQPVSLDFSPQLIGTSSAPQLVTISNVGEADSELWVETALFVGTHAEDFELAPGGSCSSMPFTLGAGESCSQHIVFSPQAPGPRSAEWLIEVLEDTVVINRSVAVAGEGVDEWPDPLFQDRFE